MIEGLPWPVWTGVMTVSVTLNAWTFIAMMRGGLVSRRVHQDQIDEKNEWRAESRIKDTQIAVKDEQLSELGEVGRSVNAVMRAVQRGATSDHEVPE